MSNIKSKLLEIRNLKLEIPAKQAGFSVIEVIFAAAIFIVFATGIATTTVGGLSANRLGEEQTIANQFASEGIEAARSMKNQAFANLINSSGTGATQSGGVWTFSGTNNQFGPNNKYTRALKVEDVQRDGSGNIVASGGTVDPLSKKITSTVTWNANTTRADSVILSTYLTNWRSTIGRGGVLVYGDGGTTTDAIKYKTIDASGVWSAAASTADIDGGSANRALRAVRVYASPSRNEKVAISRHYNGTTQYIYAQVYNGTTWGNVQLLSSWAAATFLDVQNFDGTYLANGNFMVVYSDNSVIPKMATWNGASWTGVGTSLTTLGAGNIPNFIVAKARSSTNEVMAAFYTQSTAAITQYYNGTSWSAITSHSAAGPVNTKRIIDFDWSPNNALIGGLVFASAANDRRVNIKIWTANGSGSGAWSITANATQQGIGTTRVGAMQISGRPGANEFTACANFTVPSVVCFKSDFTPTWTNPTNQTIASTTDAGIQRTFDTGYEQTAGTPAISVYSDNTTIPKLKKYTAGTTTWDAAATALSTLNSSLKTVRVVPRPVSDDLMILLGENNLDLTSVMWDGGNNQVFTPPIGNTSIETSVDSNAAGTAEAFAFTAGATSSVSQINVYLDSTSTSTNLYAGLYSDSAGAPGTLLAQANSTTLTNGAWNSITISSTNITSGTNYWIAILGVGGGVPRFRDRTGGPCVSKTSLSTVLSTLPVSWTTGSSFTTCPISANGVANGKSVIGHGINGSATTDYWYDFTWDGN